MIYDVKERLDIILGEVYNSNVGFVVNAKKKSKKPKPTKPDLWSQVKSEAKKKFDVYPSAYANLWASKKYKERGGGWKMSSSIDDDMISDENSNLEITSFTIETEVKNIYIEIEIPLDIGNNVDLDTIDVLETKILDEIEKEILSFISSDQQRLSKKNLFFIIDISSNIIFINIKISEKLESYMKKLTSDDSKLDTFENKILDAADRGFLNFLSDVENEDAMNNSAKDNYKGGLRKWLKEKWVDVSRKDKSGKHPPCGRSGSESGAYPKCRPSKKIDKSTPETSKSMSKSEKEKATAQKRRAEKKNPKSGKGNTPTYTSHKK